MFQTDIIIFLQSFSNDFLTTFFVILSSIEHSIYLVLLFTVLIFGGNYRKGYLLFHIVIWAGLTTVMLKNVFALPRPFHVDSAVKLLGKVCSNPTPLKDMDSSHFFGFLPQASIDYVRSLHIHSYGFPSGHTTGAVAFWGGIAVAFRKMWLYVVCVGLIILISLSRLYLGRHFLADVIGGYAVGLFFLFLFFRFILYNNNLNDFLFGLYLKARGDRATMLFIIYSFVVPFLVLLIPKVSLNDSSALLGINAGFFLVWLRGVPDDSGNLSNRISRVLMVLVLIFGGNAFKSLVTSHFFSEGPVVAEYILNVVAIGFLFWCSTELVIACGLMKRKK